MAVRGVFILLLFFYASRSIAQPTLPDITGSAEKDVIILSWQCQYDGIKVITVLRSSDSESNYSSIGRVRRVSKGVQHFVNSHPLAGYNYYKLTIVFKSGLTWSSNRCSVYMPAPGDTTAVPQPATAMPVAASAEDKPVEKNTSPPQKTEPVQQKAIQPALKDTLKQTNRATAGYGMSFEADTTDPSVRVLIEKSRAIAHRPVINISSSEDLNENSAMLIRSKFIFTDPISHHVNITLPDDVHTHHYSVKFYDSKKHLIIDVPKISAQNIIMDRRNFQRKGIYKFVLRKDVTELESGYITINPRP